MGGLSTTPGEPAPSEAPPASRAAPPSGQAQERPQHPEPRSSRQAEDNGSGNTGGKLLEEYQLKNVIGQGAFGIVYSCTKIATGATFAVKMVDRVETPLKEIMREVAVLQQIDHPCIMKFRDVYFERCFVCIVTDLYTGGDLINGMQSHWDSKGTIPSEHIVGLCRQMIEAIAYLHENGMVHRDIKGDNYLMDVPNIVDASLRVFLSDFGAARTVQPGERMKTALGTRTYWAPEFYDRDYGVKVDVWAVGVVIFGMLCGRFPFKDERGVKSKKPKMPANATSGCAELLEGMLRKPEQERLSAQECLGQRYFANSAPTVRKDAPPDAPPSEISGSSAPARGAEGTAAADAETSPGASAACAAAAVAGRAAGTPPSGASGTEARAASGDAATASAPLSPLGHAEEKRLIKESANAAVDERRRELVDRFANKGATEAAVDLTGPDFWITNRRTGKTVQYGWRKLSELSEELKAALTEALPAGSPNPCSSEELSFADWSLMHDQAEEVVRYNCRHASVVQSDDIIQQMLAEHGIDTSKFGTAEFKSLSQFTSEVQSGTSRLMLDASRHKELVRVVDVVLLHIVVGTGDSKKYFVQTSETYPDGRSRSDLNRFPGTKKEPHENARECVSRIVSQQLMMADVAFEFNFADRMTIEEEHESPTYPGVRTIYRKEVVEGIVTTADATVLARLGASNGGDWRAEDSDGSVRVFSWFSEAECLAKNVVVGQCARHGGDESGLVEAPLGSDQTEESLSRYLEEHGLDPRRLGEERGALKALFAELITGHCSLAKDRQGKLVRVVDVVLLKLCKESTGELLVMTGEAVDDKVVQNMLMPGEKRRPDENHFLAAKRFLKKQLALDDENRVSLDALNVRITEELKDSPTFTGLMTLYRKRIISASI